MTRNGTSICEQCSLTYAQHVATLVVGRPTHVFQGFVSP